MSRITAWIGALVFTTALCGAQPEIQTLPKELAVLETLVGDEAALVEAARRFVTREESLVEWDRELLRDLNLKSQQEMAVAKRAEIQHRYEMMGVAWEYVLSQFPNNAAANNYYGELLYDVRGDEVAGFMRWKKALAIDKELDRAHNNLGIHYFHNGDVALGLKHLTEALKLDPKHPDYLYNAAQMYLNFFPQLEKALGLTKRKLYKKAMTFSRDAARYGEEDYSLYEDYAVNFWAGENLGVEVDWEDAAKAWQEARKYARVETDLFHTLINEGRAWLKAERWDVALERLTEASLIKPDGPAIKTLMGRARAGAASEEKE